jgi:hypothetical protein
MKDHWSRYAVEPTSTQPPPGDECPSCGRCIRGTYNSFYRMVAFNCGDCHCVWDRCLTEKERWSLLHSTAETSKLAACE